MACDRTAVGFFGQAIGFSNAEFKELFTLSESEHLLLIVNCYG